MLIDYDDGGRQAAGFRGQAGDCVTRAVAIATQRPYIEVYNELNQWAKRERGFKTSRGSRRKSSSRTGIFTPTIRKYMAHLGWTWVPTMFIGQGCRVHLKAEELPSGSLICALSGHYVAVIDGVVHDTGDPTRGETRCVYGVYTKEKLQYINGLWTQ